METERAEISEIIDKYAKETYIRVLQARVQKRSIKWKEFKQMWEHYIKSPKLTDDIWSM